MTGQGEMSIREVARRLSRDAKAVHGDAHVDFTRPKVA
jgi:predicted transcriptional regulator